jgi:predicted aminopeptidase
MTVAAECRAKALEKIRQATQDKRHRRKLLAAAEAWLFLAERLDQTDNVAVASKADDDFDTDHSAA